MGYDPNDKAKLDEMQKSAGPSYAMSLVASLLSAIVLGKILEVANVNSALYGHEDRSGHLAGHSSRPCSSPDALFSRQPFKLYLINTGYQAVCYLAMGAILGGWR